MGTGKEKVLLDGLVIQVDVRTGQVVKKHSLGFGPLKPFRDPSTGAVVLASSGSNDKGLGRALVFRGSEVTTHPIGSSPQFIARYDGLAALVVGTVAELLAFPDAGGDTRAIWLRPRLGPTLRPTDWPSPQVVTLPSLNRVVLGLDFHESKKNVFWPADHIAVLDLNQSALVKVPGLDPSGSASGRRCWGRRCKARCSAACPWP